MYIKIQKQKHAFIYTLTKQTLGNPESKFILATLTKKH